MVGSSNYLIPMRSLGDGESEKTNQKWTTRNLAEDLGIIMIKT